MRRGQQKARRRQAWAGLLSRSRLRRANPFGALQIARIFACFFREAVFQFTRRGEAISCPIENSSLLNSFGPIARNYRTPEFGVRLSYLKTRSKFSKNESRISKRDFPASTNISARRTWLWQWRPACSHRPE